jgi:hypothetical protein
LLAIIQEVVGEEGYKSHIHLSSSTACMEKYCTGHANACVYFFPVLFEEGSRVAKSVIGCGGSQCHTYGLNT